MKLSLVLELLLIFVLLAFAASKSIKNQKNNNKKGIQKRNDDPIKEDNGINKYCKCSEMLCNCCRDFNIPLVSLDGPGCASLRYMEGDKLSISLNFGRKVITNRTLSGRKPSPVCMPLPGGISKFCGRVYNIARTGEDFRACLGLELQSKRTVEAAVRVSCFKFGPQGVTSEQADPLPLVPKDEKDDEDDDDDDDDDDDEDDDDDDDEDDIGLLDDDDDDGDLEAVNDVGSADYTGFSLLGDDLLGDLFGSSDNKKKNKDKKKQAPVQSTTTKRPKPSRRPIRRPNTRSTTPRTTRTTTTRTTTVRSTTPRVRSTRRPARRPTRRPNRPSKSTTVAPLTESLSTKSPSAKPSSTASPLASSSTNRIPVSYSDEENFVSVSDEKEKPIFSTMATTTPKPVTNFEDPGLQLSLASITGQLSDMPVTPIVAAKDGSSANQAEETNYEKIETITPKSSTTNSYMITSGQTDSSTTVDDNMVQIVQTLDSSEHSQETLSTDESRGHMYGSVVPNDYYEGLSLPDKKRRGNDYEDLDVLGLTEIGETVGEHLGVFGNGKKGKNTKIRKGGRGVLGEVDEYFGLSEIGETLGLTSSNKKNRRRQNKMMKGDWSQA